MPYVYKQRRMRAIKYLCSAGDARKPSVAEIMQNLGQMPLAIRVLEELGLFDCKNEVWYLCGGRRRLGRDF